MVDHGKPRPDGDARTDPGTLGTGATVGLGAQTPPPASNPSDAPTFADAELVSPGPVIGGSAASRVVLMPGVTLGGRYRIVRVLGEGGMGSVYQAQDLELERMIALKVIRPELAGNPAILQRFKQELILARHVTHKNVVRIFDLGEADGVKFITMEYVDGEDLRGILRRQGKLLPADAVGIVKQICSALEAAHAENVIHRDLKPQNVMRDKQGRVVVMDFGLARSIESSGMTQTGALIGTLEYMSPEQALGSELDQRSDLFAVGLIFYELLTGIMPYQADSAIASLMKRTQGRAVPVSEIDATVPESLSQIVAHCLERDPKDRFASATELLAALKDWPSKPSIAKPASVVEPIAAKHTPSVQISLSMPQPKIWIWAGVALLATATFFAVPYTRHLVFRPSPQSSSTSVAGIPALSQGKYLAVLPLRVVGDEKSLRYIADGLVEALSAKLFQLQELHVAASSAVDKVSAQQQSIEKIAHGLGVNLVVQGMVQGSGNKLRVTLNLEDVSGGRRVWSQEFSGVSQDLLTLQDQIYSQMVRALELRPSNEEMARGGMHPTENVAAYDLYLKARDALRGTQGTRDPNAALKFLEGALQQDPEFALAYAGLADADLRLYEDNKDSLYAEKALNAAQKAEQLNPALPEVHLSLGSVYTETGKNAEAVEELKKALALAPNSDDAYRRLGNVYRATGRRQEAIAAYQSAVAANPYYWYNHNLLGRAHFQFGENDKALQEFQKVTELASDNPIGYENIGAVYFRQGKWSDAVPAFQKALELKPSSVMYSNLGTAYFYLKRFDDSVKMFEKAVELSPKDEQWMGNLADAYRSAGRTDQATATYEKAIQLSFQQLQVNPKQAGVTGDVALYYAKKGDAAHALQYIRQARTLDGSDLQLMYYDAQILAMAGKQSEALNALREAFAKGYSPEEAVNDPTLDSLKRLPQFTALVAQFTKKSN